MHNPLSDTWTKSRFSHHVDFAIQQNFQVYQERSQIQERTAGLDVHEEVDITIRSRFAARN